MDSARLDALVKRFHNDAFDCPPVVHGFAITHRGSLRLYVGCRAGTGSFNEQDLPIPPKELGPLLVRDGPAASALGKAK